MSEIVSTFGIDWRLLLIQALNFAVLLSALWYFLYRPVIRMINNRQKLIADGVAKAQDAKRLRTQAEEERGAVVSKAIREGEGILERSRTAAKEGEARIIREAKEKEARIITEATARAEEAKNRAIEKSRAEISKMAVLAAEKILQKNHA